MQSKKFIKISIFFDNYVNELNDFPFRLELKGLKTRTCRGLYCTVYKFNLKSLKRSHKLKF